MSATLKFPWNGCPGLTSKIPLCVEEDHTLKLCVSFHVFIKFELKAAYSRLVSINRSDQDLNLR